MKRLIHAVLMLSVFFMAAEACSQETDAFIPVYAGSDIRYDDQIGFEEFAFVVDDSTVQSTEGVIRRIFCRAPEGRSPLEIIRNYESAVNEMGGSILFVTRSPQEIEIGEKKFSDVFSQNRRNYGLATSHLTHTGFPGRVTEYLAARVSAADKDVYVVLAAGQGSRGSREQTRTFFELVTLKAEPMEMGMVTAADIETGLRTYGRIAVYNIFFDTGKSDVRAESADALKVIAEYLNANKNQNVLVVGHTDNTGDFDMNIKLSKDRANAVAAKLISEHGVNPEQLKPFGAGPVSPVASNTAEQGRAKNRRVEIVER